MATRNKSLNRLKLILTAEARSHRTLLAGLRQKLRRTVSLLPKNQLQEVVISLVPDATMATLHAKSHNDPTPTDVLTYELEHTPAGDVTEGQIIICVDEALRNAKEHTIDHHRELLLYALHGLLHLCGLDDRRKKDFDLMHKTEDQILTAIGVGPTFHPQTAAPAKAVHKKPAPSGRRKK